MLAVRSSAASSRARHSGLRAFAWHAEVSGGDPTNEEKAKKKMSRIGKQPVAPVSGVTVTVDGQTVTAKGSKGELSVVLIDLVKPEMTDDGVVVTPVDDSREARSAWGLSRTLVQNIVIGVSTGFERKLAITGVGYRAQMQGSDLKLSRGFSHGWIH